MGFNAKLFEGIIYPESYTFDLDSVLKVAKGVRDYAYILHDQDDKKEHYHVMLRMQDTRNSEYIAKMLHIGHNQVEKCKGRWSDMLAYLTHSNSPKKHQYLPESVSSNFDWQVVAESATKKGKRLKEITQNIVDGLCREYNYTEFIEPDEYVQYKTQIGRAYEYRADKMRGANRKMETIYIYGEPGAGKTTYAKILAEEKGLIPFIGGASNDPLDGYKGQGCLILDDLRASNMSISDLLKMLDNHTGSLVKSRYKNKMLECSLIIITSIKSIDDLYTMFREQDEPLGQLKRRCGILIEMTKKDIIFSAYDPEISDYTRLAVYPNFVLATMLPEALTEDKKQKLLDGLIGSYKPLVKKIRKEQQKNPNSQMLQQVKHAFGGVEVEGVK